MQRIGRYVISGEIGRGASGIVYRAADPAIGRPVAVKTIRLDTLADPAERAQLRERLFREARAAGALLHPNIVTIFDAGEEMMGGQTVAYLAMELVDGLPLDRCWPGGIPNAAFQGILMQVAGALDFAHSRGIVHRDVKPANILVDRSGQAKVLDFGIAKLASQQMTHVGTLIGTPSYMSPEQVAGNVPLDGRSDQFSLAVVAYELLTGEKPFRGDTLTSLLYQITQQTPQAAHLLNPSLPPPVSVVLQRALSKHAVGRYRSCSAFLAELCGVLNQAPGWHALPAGSAGDLPTIAVTKPPVPAAEPGTRPPFSLPEPARRPANERSRIGLHWAAIVFIVALAIAGVFVYWATSGHSQPSSPDSADSTDAARRPTPLPGEATPPPNDTAAASANSPPADADAAATGPSVLAPQSQSPPPNTSPAQPSGPSAPGTHPQDATLPDFSSSEPVLVHLTTQPPGAKVSIDGGARTCVSPCAVLLPKGDHTVSYSLEAYRPGLRQIKIPGQSDIDVTLEHLTGTLMLRTTPSGASVAIDGQAIPQKTPAVVTLPVGKHRLRLSVEGKAPYDESFEIKDQVISTLNIDW